MPAPQYHALVVDDEVPVRKLVGAALAKEGFTCDFAADGVEALQQVTGKQYDAVVTDLRMPNRHGHALAVDLLNLLQRPVIVIHTGDRRLHCVCEELSKT